MQYRCTICGYVYDDAKEKVPFAALPDSWQCPLCGAPKSAFEPVGAEEAKPAVKPAVIIDEDMRQLSAGQLAALFGNLARGCEKQYKPDEAKAFREIADYFTAAVPDVSDASLEALSALLKADVQDNCPLAKAAAAEDGDRGAARICVWGEKVTRMMSNLVERYKTEGEAMLRGLNVWVCTVCGFIYIGETAPELCPVCKVPAWKFEKIEGRA